MTTVRFTNRGGTYAVASWPYDAVVVEVLKREVPPWARTWSKPRREWLIEAVYARPLAEAVRALGARVVGLDERTAAAEGDWARLLFDRLGPALSVPAYRALSRVLHPDRGGDHQLQVELNIAFAALPTGCGVA